MRLLLPRLLAVLVITILPPSVSPAATYTVTVTNDSGAGSLRQAILDANASGGADTIDFNIATGTTIPAATNLPPITDPVTIDATTQPGWVSAPIIELNGSNIGGAGQDGFKIWAGSTTIRGLVINRFTGDGIEIATNGNNVIEGCYIGTGLSGTNDLGNTLCGIFITNSTLNVIGGTNAAQRNIIAGNNQQGILIGGSNSLGNQILGNLIGLGANGSNSVANSQNGIHVHNSRSNIIGGTVTGARNIISGNSQAGVRVELAQAVGNQILGNYIGLEISGGTNRANAANGITLINAPSNFVGNATSEGRNVIAGNTGIGISVSTANYTTIQGNYIGTDATGTLDRGNTTDGITVTTSLNAVIGGTNASELNLISGNTGDGIELTGLTTAFGMVRGNLIGTDLTGTNALANGGHGIQFTTTARTNTIGGVSMGEANIIAFNTLDGIFINAGSNNVLRGNSIFNNGDLGIDLGTTAGVTPNDIGDADALANLQQNFPIITTATNEPTGTTVTGTLNSATNAAFILDLYSNAAVDASGHGEGQVYLGSTNVTTDGTGNAAFTAVLSVTNLTGRYLTATATDTNGNTSEFSSAIAAVSTLPGTTYTVVNTNDSGAGSLREAILNANATINSGDTIDFNILGSGEQTIRPLSPLPVIIDPVTIDGYTQPGSVTNTSTNGFNATVLVRIEAASAGTGANGLTIAGGGSTIRGLMITRCPGDGIELSTNGNNTITGCIIGLDATGADFGNTNNGILITACSSNIIGGTTVADRNVISGNGSSGTTADGIEITGVAASGNRILGNLIGTDLAGATNRANLGSGILLTTATGTIIGANGGEVRNVISANGVHGISLVNAAGTVILGNYIGTDATGTLDRGNTTDGIVANSATNTIIGGSSVGDGNLISGNDDGIEIAAATNVVILGNLIGTDFSGTLPLGNGNSGINLSGAARFNRIGGTGTGEANTIAYSGTDGILVTSGTNNAIRANSIYANGDLGIDLGALGGVNMNDPGDGDTGGNQLQNFPVLATATNSLTGTTVSGTLNSATNAAFLLDFYSNVALESSGHGEGQVYLGSTNITTDGTGNAAFTAWLAVTNLTGRYLTATATDTNGNTSEFSAARYAVSTLAGATFTVINTNDSGAGSLRAALSNANSTINAGDTIVFNIPGAGVQTIRPLTALPTIIDPVTLDGYTQPGSVTNSSANAFNGTLLIRIDGSNAPSGTDLLKFTIGDNSVRGLVLINALGTTGDGLEFNGGNNNFITGCLIGIDLDWSDQGNGGNGILLTSSSANTIGGTNVADRNVISGNASDGIEVSGTGSGGNLIVGNLIGTDLTGTVDRGNTADGIFLSASANNLIGGNAPSARNIISGNNSDGIQISSAGSSNNIVAGNYVGLNATGSSLLGNTGSGVNISAVPNNTIGGTAAGAGNVISGNNDGITIASAGATNNIVEGNYIGTDASGLLDFGNTDNGIILSSAMWNRVGGTTVAARNLISGNTSDGIELAGVAAGTNYIHGNWIGLSASGGVLGNSGNGILLTSSARGNLIGGTGVGEANIIANNATDGVQVATGTNNAIRLNTIYSNGDLGIDLGTTGTTANDSGDSDTGANQLQNFPVITAATNGLASIIVEGTLNSWPSANFAVDIYANSAVEASGNGEGQVYLGSTNVTTDPTGNGSFSAVFAGTLTGRYITATATDTNGNTSEFSAQFFAASSLPTTNFVVINTNDSGPGSLRDAITNANGYISGGNDTISFAIPGSGPHLISPASALPQLSDPATIDGFTQTNATANTLTNGLNTVLKIRLDGAGAGAGIDGLQVAVSGCIVQGLAITRFGGDGIEISRGAGSRVAGCFIGMDTDGLTGQGNSGSGVNISSTNTAANIIGGETAAERNLISSNTLYGVAISSSAQNTVAGNLVGTDLTGLLDRGNANSGVLLSGSTARLNLIGGTNAAARNILSGNGTSFNGAGVLLSGCVSNFIYGNYCGVSVLGTNELGNGENGVELINAAHTNFIGGPVAGAGNVLSGNPNAGVYIFGGSTSIGNVIQGNRIGTDASGLGAIGNLNRGVLVGTATHTLVGGAGPGEGNLISGNAFATGVEITCCGTTFNRVLGNWIGTDATGTNALPNGGGVSVLSSDNFVGGTNANEGNRIWFNTSIGVTVDVSATSRVTILGNSIHANGGLAIDLSTDNVTVNDLGDGDTGPNGRQNFPELNWAIADTNAGTLTVIGTLNSATNAEFRLEFYDNPAADALGYGEGRDFLFTTNLVTDGSGNAPFEFTLNTVPVPGHFIAATATTTNGSTSEFSAARKIVPFDAVDLQLALVVSEDPASITLGFSYTNTLYNAGPTNATGVIVTNYLPPGLTLISSNASQGTVSAAPGIVVWDAGSLAYSSNAVLVLTVTGGATGDATNSLTAAANETDHTPADNSTSLVNWLGIADLSLDITDTPDPATAGETFTLVTTVTNLGPDPATLVNVNLTAFNSLITTSSVVSQGSLDLTSYPSCNWDVGTLPVGGTATFTLIGVPAADGLLSTHGYLSRAEVDLNGDNNSLTIDTTVQPGVGILQLDSATYSVSENGGWVTVGIVRTAGASNTVTVDFATTNLQAIAGTDFVATNLTLTFTNGETYQSVDIPVLDDLNPECNEAFGVFLSNPTGGAHTFITTNALVLITDNELTASGGITLLSRATNGTSGTGSSPFVVPSANGKFLAFQSFAEDLVGSDANGREDVFIVNATNGAITLVSVDMTGTNSGNGISYSPRISADGRFVAFQSESTNLVAGATNRFGDIYVRDTVAGTTRLVSVNAAGTGPGNDYSSDAQMTPDGRFLVFASYSTNLASSDLNSYSQDVFLRDTNSATCELISINATGTGTANSESYAPVLSADGRYVAFASVASDLGPTDTNFSSDIYVRDRNTGSNFLCSIAVGGGSGDLYSFEPKISSNGVVVIFGSYASNLVTGDTNSSQDIFAYNTTNHTVQLVSVKFGGSSGGDNDSFSPVVSADGRYVAFASYAGDLVADDTNDSYYIDVFVRDLVAGTTELISINCAGTSSGNGDSTQPTISDDGRYIAFTSGAADLVPGDFSAGYEQVYRHDRQTGETVLVSQNTTLTGGGEFNTYNSALNADGHVIAFISEATTLTTNLYFVVPNALLWDATAAPAPVGSVNLVLAKTAATNTLVEFTPLAYTLAISNLGTLASSGTVVTDALPANVTFISATTSVGTVTNAGSLVTANLGALGISSNALITITVMPTNFGLVTNIALAASPETDSAPADNTGTAIVTVTAFPPPTLYTLRTNSQVLILWPSNTPPVFVLETKTNLQPAVIWSSVTNSVAVLGTNNSVTLTPDLSERTRFFRLRR